MHFHYAHLNRLIAANNLNRIIVVGPEHGGLAIVANTYLEGSYIKHYSEIEQNRNGAGRL